MRHRRARVSPHSRRLRGRRRDSHRSQLRRATHRWPRASAGLRPRYADVDPDTLCLSAVNGGSSADAQRPRQSSSRTSTVDSVTSSRSVRSVERGNRPRRGLRTGCRRAAGGRRAGSFGDAAAFSFYPTKNLAAVGDGGAVAIRSDEDADRVRRLREYGWGQKYAITIPGGRNSRLDELQAAFLRIRLTRLDERNSRRRAHCARSTPSALAPRAGRFVAATGKTTSLTLPFS